MPGQGGPVGPTLRTAHGPRLMDGSEIRMPRRKKQVGPIYDRKTMACSQLVRISQIFDLNLVNEINTQQESIIPSLDQLSSNLN